MRMMDVAREGDTTELGGGLQAAARERLAAGDAPAAVALLRRATSSGRQRVSVVHDLVRAHLADGDLSSATLILRQLVAAVPHRPDLALQLGQLLHQQGRHREALDACRAAAGSNPENAQLWRAVGALASDLGERHEAFAAWRRACDVEPDNQVFWRRLITAARSIGDDATVAEAIDRWFELAPDDPSARHLRAAVRGETPDRADPRYVTDLFDAYARTFDDHLAKLGYRTPAVMEALVAEVLGGRRAGHAADLGCGTGQIGALMRPHADQLDGVDLSTGMLTKAHARGCYDHLYRGDLVEFLRHRPATFDLLVSGDTLNYLGDLRPFLLAARASLRHGGVLIASLEEAAEPIERGFRLGPSGRFEHSPEWVERELQATGFDATLHRSVLRRESGREVSGLLIVARPTGTGNSPDERHQPDGADFATTDKEQP